MDRPYKKPVQAALRSKAGIARHSRPAWMKQALAGTNISDVTVAQIIMSRSAGWSWADSRARRAAARPRLAEVSLAAAMRRSPMPVRERIHSSDVSRLAGKSPLRNDRAGKLLPVPSSMTPKEVLMDHLENQSLTTRGAPITAPVLFLSPIYEEVAEKQDTVLDKKFGERRLWRTATAGYGRAVKHSEWFSHHSLSWGAYAPQLRNLGMRALHLRRHLESLAIFAGQQGVGLFVIDKNLLGRLHSQLAADAALDCAEVDLVVLEVLFHALEGFASVLVLGEGLRRLAERLFVTEAIADVAQMAQGAGEMAFENVGVEVLDLAAADGLDEVAIMVFAAVEFLDDLALGGESGRFFVTGADHVTVGAVPDIADPGAEQSLGQQSAHLKNQLTVAVIEDTNLRVGGLAIIEVAVAAADAENAFGQLLLVQPPTRLVHLVNALVAQVAVTGVPDPVPIVV